jgi:hypothetical protein
VKTEKRGKWIMMEYTQSLAMWRAMASIIERGAPREANQSQPEEVFVPFHLPPVKAEPTEEAKPPVAVPASSSEAMPVGV